MLMAALAIVSLLAIGVGGPLLIAWKTGLLKK